MDYQRTTTTQPRSHRQQNRHGENKQTPEQYLAHQKEQAIAQVMAAFNKWLNNKLDVISYAYETADAEEPSDPNGNTGGSAADNAAPRRSSKRSKRQLDGDDPDESAPGGDGGNGGDGKGNKRAKKDGNPERMLACPFFKRDPHTWSHERTCCGPGFPTIHRLK